MVKQRVLILVVGAVVACATPALAALRGENLLAPLPTGFVAGAGGQNGKLQTVEFIPKGETASDWSRMVTVQIHHDARKADPVKANATMGANWRSACPGGGVEPVAAGRENGYPMSLWQFTCPNNASTGKPETMWMKAIGAADSFYTVQYAARSLPSVSLASDAMNYLKRIAACDTRRKESPCPDGM